mmetsp:Transcript_32467/g.58239  ORF Transcript_32467/g.58239 Transcript_32467/m.58239 type:complete len:282 (+) Transcript_32467:230-1075(+)
MLPGPVQERQDRATGLARPRVLQLRLWGGQLRDHQPCVGGGGRRGRLAQRRGGPRRLRQPTDAALQGHRGGGARPRPHGPDAQGLRPNRGDSGPRERQQHRLPGLHYGPRGPDGGQLGGQWPHRRAGRAVRVPESREVLGVQHAVPADRGPQGVALGPVRRPARGQRRRLRPGAPGRLGRAGLRWALRQPLSGTHRHNREEGRRDAGRVQPAPDGGGPQGAGAALLATDLLGLPLPGRGQSTRGPVHWRQARRYHRDCGPSEAAAERGGRWHAATLTPTES